MKAQENDDDVFDYSKWVNADKETVKQFLLENTNIKEYKSKKEKLLCEIEKKTPQS